MLIYLLRVSCICWILTCSIQFWMFYLLLIHLYTYIYILIYLYICSGEIWGVSCWLDGKAWRLHPTCHAWNLGVPRVPRIPVRGAEYLKHHSGALRNPQPLIWWVFHGFSRRLLPGKGWKKIGVIRAKCSSNVAHCGSKLRRVTAAENTSYLAAEKGQPDADGCNVKRCSYPVPLGIFP